MPFRLLADSTRIAPSALESAVAAAPPDLELRLHGGMPAERLDLTFALRSDGVVAAQLFDRIGERERATQVEAPRERAELARAALFESGILRVEAIPPLIPPDSVIGELRMTAGGDVLGRWVFVGDVDQAGMLADLPPLQLIRAVGPLMTLGKEALEIPTVSPNLIADAPGPLYIAPADFDLVEETRDAANVVLYNLRPEPLPLGGFVLRDLTGGELELPQGTVLEPHGLLRVPMRDLRGLNEAAPMEGGGGGSVMTVVDRSGAEIARRVRAAR